MFVIVCPTCLKENVTIVNDPTKGTLVQCNNKSCADYQKLVPIHEIMRKSCEKKIRNSFRVGDTHPVQGVK